MTTNPTAMVNAGTTMAWLESHGRIMTVQFQSLDAVSLDLKAMVQIDPDRAEAQLAETPTMLAYVGNVLRNAKENHWQKQQQRRLVEASLDQSIRARHEGGKKPTEDSIKNEIRQDASYQFANDEENRALLQIERFESALHSIRARQDALIEIVQTKRSEYNRSRPTAI